MKYFETECVSEHIIRIKSFLGMCAYLVVGQEKAALIDTCEGIGDLKKVVKELTNKPCFVILTHGHFDHVNGCGQFDEVYLNKKDFEICQRDSSWEFRQNRLQEQLGEKATEIPKTDFILPKEDIFKELEDGATFDLGNICLRAIEVPGHTQGMTCILIEDERTIIFGDACGTCGLLFKEESSTIVEYQNSLLNLKKWENQYDTVLRNHGNYCSPKDVLDNNIELCKSIINRTDDKEPFLYRGVEHLLAKKIDEKLRRIDGKEGNIAYDESHIF